MRTIATTTNDNSNVASLPSPTRPQTSKEVIAANVQLLIEQLEAGHSEGLTAYLTAMGKFHNYSFGNILEIARQKPDATRVAGLYAWNQLGRKVMKGQRGIRILAPMIGSRVVFLIIWHTFVLIMWHTFGYGGAGVPSGGVARARAEAL